MSTEITFDDKHIYCGTRIVADIRQDLPSVYRRELEGYLQAVHPSKVVSAVETLCDRIEYHNLDQELDEEFGVLRQAGLIR